MRAHVRRSRRVVAVRAEVAWFSYKRAIHRGSAGLMMRHLVSDARTGASARRCSPQRANRKLQIVGDMDAFGPSTHALPVTVGHSGLAVGVTGWPAGQRVPTAAGL